MRMTRREGNEWLRHNLSDGLKGGNDYRLHFALQGRTRKFTVHIPPSFKSGMPIVFTADGITILNPDGSMAEINAVDASADKHGFIAVHLHALPRHWWLGSLLTGWHIPDGPLRWSGKYDDRIYGLSSISTLRTSLGLDGPLYGVGFSTGAQYLLALACYLGLEADYNFAGLGIVSGTWLGSEGIMPAGIKAAIIHGTGDPTLPLKGGVDWSQPKMRALKIIGHLGLKASRPELIPTQFIASHELPSAPTHTQIEEVFNRYYYGPRDLNGHAPIEWTLMKEPYHGHAFHGRYCPEDGSAESALSKGHGRPAPPEVFSCLNYFAGFFGW